MSIRRVVIAGMACLLLMSSGTAAAFAQGAGSDEQLCISIAGAAPEGGWDILSLSVAIASGNATISSVGAAGDCAAAAPVAAEPTAEPPVDEPATEPLVDEPATEPDVAGDAPLPIEVVESAIFGRGEEAAFYALLRNPNPTPGRPRGCRCASISWTTRAVSCPRTTGRDAASGQTGAIIGWRGDAQGATQIEVAIANGETDWTDVPEVPGDLTFSQLKTKVTDSGTKTTGRVSSTYDTQVESVNVYVVYRDASGEVVGANNTYIDFIPAAGDANFMLESWSEKKPDVASTEVYYDGFLPPTE